MVHSSIRMKKTKLFNRFENPRGSWSSLLIPLYIKNNSTVIYFSFLSMNWSSWLTILDINNQEQVLINETRIFRLQPRLLDIIQFVCFYHSRTIPFTIKIRSSLVISLTFFGCVRILYISSTLFLKSFLAIPTTRVLCA
jgi:hypothetical protein